MDCDLVYDRDRCIRTEMTSNPDISINNGKHNLLFIRCENSSPSIKTPNSIASSSYDKAANWNRTASLSEASYFLYVMAGLNTNLTTRLRDAVGNWNTHLQGIKDPDDVFRQERARISDVSKKRINEFYPNTLHDTNNNDDSNNNNNDDKVDLLLRALLSDSRQLEQLDVEHEATRTKKQELQDEGARTVGRRIVADVIDILGLSAVQHLIPMVSSLSEDATSTTKDCVDSTSLPVPHGSDAPPATIGLTTRTRSYNTRKNGGSRQKAALSIGPSVSEGDSSVCHQTVKIFMNLVMYPSVLSSIPFKAFILLFQVETYPTDSEVAQEKATAR